MQAYQHHIADYRSRTYHLSQLERWVYRDLLDVLYEREQPLPADLETVCRLVGARSAEHKEAVRQVLETCFVCTAQGWVHEQAMADIQASQARSRKAAAGARQRWHAQDELAAPASTQPCPSNALAMPTQCISSASASTQHSPSTAPAMQQLCTHHAAAMPPQCHSTAPALQQCDASPLIPPSSPIPPLSPLYPPTSSQGKERREEGEGGVGEGEVPSRGPRAAVPLSLPAWLAMMRAKGERPIPLNDPIRAYAQQAGIPEEYMRLAWWEFRQRHKDGAKRYKDWREVFRRAVRGNWLRLWYCDDITGQWRLTSAGHQAQRVMEATEGAAA